jgi:integrase
LLSALNWAHDHDLLVDVPKVKMPHRGREQKLMKGWPITGEEFERLLMVTPKTIGKDAAASWEHYLHGLWTSGLRLEESLNLRWDDAPGSIVVDLTGRHRMLRIPGSCQKSGRDQVYPLAPEFAEFLLQTPEADRRGRVFKLQAPSGRSSWAMRTDTVSVRSCVGSARRLAWWSTSGSAGKRSAPSMPVRTTCDDPSTSGGPCASCPKC